MQPDRPSSTAEMVAAWRALEHLLPAGERILDDPYARGFLGPNRGAVLDVAEKLPPRALKALFRRVDRILGGVMTFVLARHRFMDELAANRDGLQQLVLLGAGYDSRPIRLADRLQGVTVFEVDHPATAARKASLAAEVFGDAKRAETTFVSIDFARESISDKLLAAGLRRDALTVWIWEGVSMYLDEAAVRATFDLVREHSAPGSLLTFDAWQRPDTGVQRITARELPALAMRLVYDEPFVWGPQPEDLEPMLREHGLALIEHVEHVPLVARYGKARRRLVPSHMALCVAEVERPD
jgi:methyltransferase (TIGR00027 family)